MTEATSINKLITKKIHKYHLVYRASECQFAINDFYKKIAVIQRQLKENHLRHKQTYNMASLILLKTEYGKVLGGYTPIEWEPAKRSINSDDDENP